MIQSDYDTWARIDAKFKENQEVKLEAAEAPAQAPYNKANTSVLIGVEQQPQKFVGEGCTAGASEQTTSGPAATEINKVCDSIAAACGGETYAPAPEPAGRGYQSNLQNTFKILGLQPVEAGILRELTSATRRAFSPGLIREPYSADPLLNVLKEQSQGAFAGQDEERCSLFVPREEFDRLLVNFWNQSTVVNALLRRVAALEMKIGSQE